MFRLARAVPEGAVHVDCVARNVDDILDDLEAKWPLLPPGGVLSGTGFIQADDPHRWADHCQRAVRGFLVSTAFEGDAPDVFLVPEPDGKPWPFYMVKQ